MGFCLIFIHVIFYCRTLFCLCVCVIDTHLFTLGALFVSCSDRVDKLRLYWTTWMCTSIFSTAAASLCYCTRVPLPLFWCVHSLAFGRVDKRNTFSTKKKKSTFEAWTMPKTRSHCLKCCNHFFFSFRVWIFLFGGVRRALRLDNPGQQNGKIYEKKSLVQNIEISVYACTIFQFDLFNKVCVLLSSASVWFVRLFVCLRRNIFFSSFFGFCCFCSQFWTPSTEMSW